jgi:hypothetical protein
VLEGRRDLALFREAVGCWPGTFAEAALSEAVERSEPEPVAGPPRGALRQGRSAGSAVQVLESGVLVVGSAAVLAAEDAEAGPRWDVVESIEPAGEEEVYDLTVPGAHSFLAGGLLVHNSTYARCGIIVNVTPLEPEWEGVITIEISNTTPLPAKIYAGEGIAQILFFLGDQPCETSYKDRGGKYQNQVGLTLPIVEKGVEPGPSRG